MPGWHEATKRLQDEGKIRMVGIVQEQHPDRAGLFMQWKRMSWPLLVDSYNLLGVSAVPITVAIDENGIVREVLAPIEEGTELGDDFLRSTFGAAAPTSRGGESPRSGRARAGDAGPPHASPGPDLATLHRRTRSDGTAGSWVAYTDAIVVHGGPGRVEHAIEGYGQAVALDPDHEVALFRLGVAYRMRHDSDHRREGDFARAVERWSGALERDPNQYIWRRRIQQYGPRLEKPYPFYDWVREAREEIRSRGEEPVPLVVEPGGSELAVPQRDFSAASDEVEPDPAARILRDRDEFVRAEVVPVPPRVEAGGVVRVHFEFRPIVEKKAHWNNEADDMLLWVDPPDGWQVDRRLLRYGIPPEVVSQETRTLEVELRAPEEPGSGRARIPAYALYYVCEDVNGVCMYRRQDLEVGLTVRR